MNFIEFTLGSKRNDTFENVWKGTALRELISRGLILSNIFEVKSE